MRESYDVYIGRANRRYRLAASPWANPYREGRDGDRGEVIAKYEPRRRAILRAAMPEERRTPDPLELTHRAYASLNRRDLDAFVGLLAPSCVYDLSRFDLGTYTGPDAIRRFYEEWIGPLYEFGVVVDDIESLGNGVLYAVQTGHRGSSPNFSFELGGGVVGVWEHGKLARVTVYPDIDEARAAAERLAEERG